MKKIKVIHLTKLLISISTVLLMMYAAYAHAFNGPVASSCRQEIQKLCPNVPHGHGQVRQCLGTHKNELSEGCKNALNTTGGGWHRNQQQ